MRRLLVFVLLSASVPLWSAPLELSWMTTQSQASSFGQEVGYLRQQGQAAYTGSFLLTDQLRLWGTAWASLDSLPGDSPLEVPSRKITFSSRLLEGGITWEAIPGTLVVDAGKKLLNYSSGFSQTPLNLLSRPGNDLDAQAVSHWEEGWAGAGLTWFSDAFTLSTFLIPELDWPSYESGPLSLVSSPQHEVQNLTKWSVRFGDADFQLLNLVRVDGAVIDPTYRDTVGIGADGQLTESISVRAEAATVNRENRLTTDGVTERSETIDWPVNAMAGVTWTVSDSLNFMVEYGYHGDGFFGGAYRDAVDFVAAGGDSSLLSQSGSLNTATHYGFLRVAGKIVAPLEADAWVKVNLQDASGVYGGSVSFVQDQWTLTGKFLQLWGGSKTEAGISPLLNRVAAELRVYL